MSWIKRHGEHFFFQFVRIKLNQLTAMFIILVTSQMISLSALLSGQIERKKDIKYNFQNKPNILTCFGQDIKLEKDFLQLK